jgi:hypothetical protein
MKKKSPKLVKKPPVVIRSLAKAIHQQAMELWQPDTPSSMERLIRGLGSKRDRDT